jgi:tetratricopeptide (TPR) repeat protein
MAETVVTGLELRLQKQVESARAAFERGRYDHAVEMCVAVLREQPSCLPVRKILRSAQLKAKPAAKVGTLGRLFSSISGAPLILTGSRQLKDQPLAAVAAADKLLAGDANNVAALGLLGRAATALGWLDTAIFAGEAARAADPDRADLHLALGQTLLAAGRLAEAVQAAQQALRLQPSAAAQDLLRNASVAVTMAKGNWETEGNYRAKLHDEAKAAQLEQAARIRPDQPSA